LDNRIGGFMIAEVARLLHENKVKLPFSLHIVNAVQEEIGLRGAEMIAERIKPHVAIITDVCHDTGTPMMDKIQQGDLKGGRGPCTHIWTGGAEQSPEFHHRAGGGEENSLSTRRRIPRHRNRHGCLRVFQ
jgi:putative aminopeptidase FrvX